MPPPTAPDAPPVAPAVRRWWARGGLVGAALLGAVAVAASTALHPAEDALILFDYARALAERGLVTWGGADVPIDGATDTLWMVAIAALVALGSSPYLAALLISAAAAWWIGARLAGRGGRLLAVAALATTPFAWSALAGFGTLAFSAAFVLVVAFAAAGAARACFLASLVLCLIRPDGAVWALGPCVLVAAQAPAPRRRVVVGEALLFLLLPGAAYAAMRALYFEAWLPLPLVVKASGLRDLGPFVSASLPAIAAVAVPSLLALAAARDRRVTPLMLAITVVPSLAFACLHLEQNVGNRLLAPMFFGAAWLLGHRHRGVALAFVALVALASARTAVDTVLTLLESRAAVTPALARDLAATPGRMLVTEAGALPYYSRWRAEDAWGLNTPRFAYEPLTADHLRSTRADLVVAHCRLALLDPAVDLAVPGTRSWDALCAVLLDWARGRAFDVRLVPYLQGPRLATRIKQRLGVPTDDCRRHDIYLVDARSPIREALLEVIGRHGGRELPLATGRIDADAICEPPVRE